MKGGAIQQSNFNDYQVMRMSDMPEIHIKIIATDNPPDRHGRGRHPHRRAGDRQRGGATHRQAAPRTCRCRRTG